MRKRGKIDADATRRRILDAALDSFARNGYEQTTLNGVAARVHLTKGAVFWHFRNKADLFEALVADLAATYRTRLDVPEQPPASPNEMRRLLEKHARLIIGTPYFRKWFRMMQCGAWPSRPALRLRRVFGTMRRTLVRDIACTLRAAQTRGGVRTDVDAHEAAEVLGALWLGLLDLCLSQRVALDLPHALTTGFDAAFTALSAERRAGRTSRTD